MLLLLCAHCQSLLTELDGGQSGNHWACPIPSIFLHLLLFLPLGPPADHSLLEQPCLDRHRHTPHLYIPFCCAWVSFLTAYFGCSVLRGSEKLASRCSCLDTDPSAPAFGLGTIRIQGSLVVLVPTQTEHTHPSPKRPAHGTRTGAVPFLHHKTQQPSPRAGPCFNSSDSSSLRSRAFESLSIALAAFAEDPPICAEAATDYLHSFQLPPEVAAASRKPLQSLHRWAALYEVVPAATHTATGLVPSSHVLSHDAPELAVVEVLCFD